MNVRIVYITPRRARSSVRKKRKRIMLYPITAGKITTGKNISGEKLIFNTCPSERKIVIGTNATKAPNKVLRACDFDTGEGE